MYLIKANIVLQWEAQVLLSKTNGFNQNTQEFIWGWSWFEACCFTDPLRKASFEAGSGLNLSPLQILRETCHLRLQLVWNIFFYKSLKKSFVWGWSWFEASSFTDPLRGLHLKLDLVWSILLYKSFKRVFIWSWIWFETFWFLKEYWNFDQRHVFSLGKPLFLTKNLRFP